jgi:hypothetical protein
VLCFSNSQGEHKMLNDGFYVTRQPQPGLTWQAAAVRFEQTRDQFLRITPDKPDPIGLWHSSCFPVKEHTGRGLGKKEKAHVREIVQLFRDVSASKRYARASEIEQLFKKYLEYPPYNLSDSWDGQATKRIAWAEIMLSAKQD